MSFLRFRGARVPPRRERQAHVVLCASKRAAVRATRALHLHCLEADSCARARRDPQNDVGAALLGRAREKSAARDEGDMPRVRARGQREVPCHTV